LPADIPGNPSKIYAHAGWAGFGDWLGTGFISPRYRQFRSFKKLKLSRVA
jgi:hypothetical protein